MEFEEAQNTVRQVQRQATEHRTYKEQVRIDRSVDLSPEEFSSLAYADLVNAYERIGKILSTQKMLGATTATAKTREEEKKAEEFQKNVKEITTQSLEAAEAVKQEMQKAPIDTEITFEKIHHEERPSSKDEPSSDTRFESYEELDLPKNEESTPPGNLEKVAKIQKMPSYGSGINEPLVPPVSAPVEQKTIEKKIETQVQTHQKYADLDNPALKKKMLELTKLLFKESNTTRRNEIKDEIAVIKDLLSQTESRRRKEGDVALMLEGILRSQSDELVSAKEHIITQFEDKLAGVRNSFYANLADETAGSADTKERHELFIKKITEIHAQIGPIVEQYAQLLDQKHSQELNAILAKMDPDDPLAKKIKEEEKKTKKYADALSEAKDVLEKKFETLMEGGLEATKKASPENSAIFDIQDMEEAELLNYLLAHDSATYKKYQAKKISKHEALTEAKVLIAREKGISDKMIRTYFGGET